MKKLLSLLVLVSIAFTLQNCINQGEVIDDENNLELQQELIKTKIDYTSNNNSSRRTVFQYIITYSNNVSNQDILTFKDNNFEIIEHIESLPIDQNEFGHTSELWFIYGRINFDINKCANCKKKVTITVPDDDELDSNDATTDPTSYSIDNLPLIESYY